MTQRIGPKYPIIELARALQSGSLEKAGKWKEVLAGMATGALTIGSRKPVADMPVWATPEVARGGFATGGYAAGGDLLSHERKLADEVGTDFKDTGRVRAALNAWYLTDEGLARLRDMASTGCFDAMVPEETALLVVALVAESAPDAADSILETITPFFDRLRFYPRPRAHPPGDGVHVRTVGELRRALETVRPSDQLLIQNATLTVWIPLYDRLVDLVNAPIDDDWMTWAEAWRRDYDGADQAHMSRRWRRPDGPFQRCRSVLVQRLEGETPPASDTAYARMVLGRHAAKYGTGSARDAYRADQARQNIDVWFDALAAVMLKRLADHDDMAGIEDIDTALASVSSAEARDGAPEDAALSASITRRVMTVRMAPVADLVESGQISSPEVLAAVLPQVTSQVLAKGFADRSESAVFAALYRAFRRRRSLLLLDLQSQVRLDELPWGAALSARHEGSLNDESVAREALQTILALTLTHFPHVQFPNALVDDLESLARHAKLDIPFTRELAADIFEGRFSKPFDRSAEICVARYHGTLYGRYFNLPQALPRGGLGSYCRERAGQSNWSNRLNWSVAGNGEVIEQQLVLTSHNLAAVFGALDLSDLDYADLATRSFRWICARQQVIIGDRRLQLQMLKNTAYAWRQMIAFLSELDTAAQTAAFQEIEAIFEGQTYAFRNRFDPAMLGLREAMQDIPLSRRKGRVFLGWSAGHHPFAV